MNSLTIKNAEIIAKNRWKASIALFILPLVLMGCGKTSQSTSNLPNSTDVVWAPLPQVSPTYSPSPTASPTSQPTNLLPAITESFSVSGSGGTSPSFTTTVNTDNLLKVKITAGSAGQVTDPNYGFSGTYSCVSYKVTALGSTQTTQILSVASNTDLLSAYNCPGAASSQTLDFSARLTPGHGPVTITVEASGYDFYCRGCETSPWLYGAYPYGPYSCSLYCPSRPVYKTHTVTGSLAIQVNGTSF